MPLPKLPVQNLDDINHRRRARETLNQILDHSFDDSRVQTAAEIAAGVTPVNYSYQPGNVWRFLSAQQVAYVQSGTTTDVGGALVDLSDAIQAAMDSTNGDVYFPSGVYYIGKPLYVKSASVFNMRFVGESRVSAEILPNATNIQDANLVNALIINQKVNGKFSLFHIRLTSLIGWNGVCISAVASGPASQNVIFSGTIDDCWFDPGSSNGGFFTGGLINYVVSNTTFEFLKGCFNFTSIYADVHFTNISLSSCYDHFITSTVSGGNVVRVNGVHAYTHNRGNLFVVSNATDLKFTDISVQAALPNAGTVGLFDLTNCTAVEAETFSCLGNAVNTSTATAGTTTTVLTDSTLALTVNAYAGYTLYNSTRGLSQTIVSNTGTTITTAAIAGQVSGDTYQIVWPSTGLPLGLGQIQTAITLQGVIGNFSDGMIMGADVGILVHGSGAQDASFDQVNVTRSNTAAFRNTSAGGTASGSIRATNCNWSDCIGSNILFTNVGTMEFIVWGSRILNGGLGGNANNRNITTATSANARFYSCVVGRDNALAAAGYYNEGSSAGASLEFFDTTWVGTPPTGITLQTTQVAVIKGTKGRVVPTYGASTAINSILGDLFEIVPNNGTAFTVANPPAASSTPGMEITIRIKNTTGGALGALTFDTTFKASAWTQPATGFSRSITCRYDGTNWVQANQTGVDVPN